MSDLENVHIGFRFVGRVIRDGKVIDEDRFKNLLTNAGRVYLHSRCYGSSGNPANYFALTDNAAAPAVTDTALTGEITTNGLGRALATVTLPAGAGTQTTLYHQWTATGNVLFRKVGIFTASSGGTLVHVAQLAQRALGAGDIYQLTATITMGA